MNPILVLAPVAALFMIAVLAIGKWSNAEEKLAKFIKCYGESIVESNDYYYALLDILSDTEADWAMEMVSLNNDMLDNIVRSNKKILARDTAYNKLFESYEKLKADYLALQSKYNKLYRPRCPKCNRFLKDGKCSNEKCNKIDLSNLPDIFNAETAGRVIESGGYVSWAEFPDWYYALSTINDGSVGCFNINKAPSAGWCYKSVQQFVKTYAAYSFTKATPDFLKKPGKPKEIETKPLLADAKVGDLCKRRDGKWVQIDRLCSLGGLPWICYEIGGLRYINNGQQLNSKPSDADIIHTEPLAPEGSKEWAWQQMLLRNMVCHDNHTNGGHYEMKGNIAYFTHAVGKIESDCTELDKKSWIKAWGRGVMRNYVWQIYPEDIADDSKADETDNKADGKQDITDAPFEGLDGVKVGDPILFSDGVVRNVKRIDWYYNMQDRIVVSPAVEHHHKNGYGCVFEISNGKHWENKTPIRAIRIATKSDLAIYGGSND